MLLDLLTTNTEVAAFLDVDGTLLDIAATPDAVVVPPRVPELLYRLWVHLDGALALISGRPLQDVDRLFAPYRFPAAGVHGCELREPTGCVLLPKLDLAAIGVLHEELAAFAFKSPGVLIEYKSYGAAVHCRLSPEAEPEVAACVQQALAKMGPGFVLQRGKSVYEVKPIGYSKGTAIRNLMEQRPFRQRHPLFIGDDLTDEAGFEAVNLSGGTSIRVGEGTTPTLARHTVATVAQVHELLAALLAAQH
jgi:trehalose 6-phosphate phosphatase